MRKILVILTLLLPLICNSQEETKKTPITVSELSEGVHRLFVNNAVSVVAFSGTDGLLIIDTGYERTAIHLKEKLDELSTKPLKYIVNTHIHGDHTGGNLILGKDVDIIAHSTVKEYLSKDKTQGDKVIPAFPEYAQPNITFTDRMTLDYNGQILQLIHLPQGHTNGDIIIFFPKSNVIVVGDLLFANYFPYVDTGNGGNPLKYIENIDWIIRNFPKDAKVVGGHGPVYSIDEYKNYKQTLENTIEVIKKFKLDGLTPEQMKEQKVLKDWESYGSFFITAERWIDTLYPFL